MSSCRRGNGIQNSHRSSLCRLAALLFTMLVCVTPFISRTLLADEPASPKLTEYVSEGNYFTCLLPAGWSRYEAPDYSRELSKVYGIQVHQGGIGSRVEISVKYYAKDNKLQKNVEQFIKMHAQPIFGPEEGETYGPVRHILVNGARAKTFERRMYEYEDHVYDPKSGRYYTPLHPRKFEMFERFIVIPARLASTRLPRTYWSAANVRLSRPARAAKTWPAVSLTPGVSESRSRPCITMRAHSGCETRLDGTGSP